MSVMTQLGASLRFVELPAVVELLASVCSTGRLRLASGDWAGEIVLRRGQIVGAALRNERGLAALEGIALGFTDGELKFADGPVAEGDDALLAVDQQVPYLSALNEERQRLEIGLASLHLVPRLIESSAGDAPEARITVGAVALQVIPQLMYGHSVAELARQRGLARTLRDMSVLVQAGVVGLEATPARGGLAQREAPTPVVPVRIVAPRPSARSAPARLMPSSPRPRPTWQTRVTPITPITRKEPRAGAPRRP
jgi:hypothetical protein